MNFQRTIQQLRAQACAAKFHDPTQQAEGKASRWVNEPVGERHPDLIQHTNRPFNAEPSNVALCNMITPKGQHYRRTHAPVPVVDETYRLKVSIEGLDLAPRQFSVAQIKSLSKTDLACTFMCTGNRRGEYNKYGSTLGLPWGNGSISTSRWAGARLREVLALSGLTSELIADLGLKYVTFIGLEGYHVSIDIDKALDPRGDVLVAYQMNGEDIPRDHGYPLRIVCPGYVGARSVKWMDKIIVSPNQTEGPHQTGYAYKGFAPNVKTLKGLPKDFIESIPPIDQIPVTSALCLPENGSTVSGSSVTLQGYAYSGFGRSVYRVDVSNDDGKTWTQAELTRADSTQTVRSGRSWAWVQWRANVPVKADEKGEMKLICKAIDDQYNQQPQEVAPIWNIRGILNTSWGRSTVKVQA